MNTVNRMNELFSDSLENVTCHHLLALTKKQIDILSGFRKHRLVVCVFISGFRLCVNCNSFKKCDYDFTI